MTKNKKRSDGQSLPEKSVESTSGNNWIVWVVGCLIVMVIGVAVGGYFIWKAGQSLTANMDEYAEEFGDKLEDEFEDVMKEAIENVAEDSGEDVDFEEINRMIEAGDWEAIEEMGKDLEKIN